MDIKATWNENTKKSRFPDQLWTLVSFVMLASNSTFWVVISSIIQGCVWLGTYKDEIQHKIPSIPWKDFCPQIRKTCLIEAAQK